MIHCFSSPARTPEAGRSQQVIIHTFAKKSHYLTIICPYELTRITVVIVVLCRQDAVVCQTGCNGQICSMECSYNNKE